MPRVPSLQTRAAGLLLHPTSLPSAYGSGDLGPEAHKFVDYLSRAGMRWWQVLPTGPVDDTGSPYNSTSAMGGSMLLISPVLLAEEGLLTDSELRAARVPHGPIRYATTPRKRRKLLDTAFRRFRPNAAYQRFVQQSRSWLEDLALFNALREAHNRLPWWEWDPGVKQRRKSALTNARRELADAVAFHRFVQFQFHRQWTALRKRCHKSGIGLIGDIPIFVAHDSADVWANRSLFNLDKKGLPREVSGAAPDAFSKTGQLWGHPLYNWPKHKAEDYAWWVSRFERMFEQFDAVRIDHFLGFLRCWATPAGHKTAARGRWRKGPGEAFFGSVEAQLGELPVIAEDLGLLTPEAERLRDRYAFPGMRVLQFGFGHADSYHAPHNCPINSVIYTGTHDNDTVRGWYTKAKAAERRRAVDYAQTSAAKVHEGLTRLALSSPSRLAIVPAQDVLGLNGDARMNTPGTQRGNWRWRLKPGQLKAASADRLREWATLYARV